VGTFVVNPSQQLTTSIGVLESATKIIMDHGYTPGTLNMYADVREADERISVFLGISKGDKVLYIERVRAADGKPVVYVMDYVDYKEGMELEYERTKPESLLSFLESQFDIKIGYVICGIKAVISDKKIEGKLQLKSPKALLLLEQTHFSVKGQPVFYSDSYFISDKFNFNIIRKRI
jgi:GntR family transcriptional regulator